MFYLTFCETIVIMRIVWAKSALKHGIQKEEAEHAIFNARITNRNFTDSRLSGQKLVALMGPQTDSKKPELEIIIWIQTIGTVNVIHVMEARKSFEARIIRG